MTETGHRVPDLPLFGWALALRQKRIRYNILRRRTLVVGIVLLCVGATILVPPRPLLIWNASASAPVGLYAVGAGDDIAVGDMIAAGVPVGFRQLAAARHYIPLDVPLVKRVAAVAGDDVCAVGARIFINAKLVATRRTVDGKGRSMPWWRGCIRLRHGALFLLSPAQASAFDGRYFGPSAAETVLGKAYSLWTR